MFFGGGMGMFNDPFFSDMHNRMNAQMQQMDSLMNHMMGGGDPFGSGMMMDPLGMHRQQQQQQHNMLAGGANARQQMIEDGQQQQYSQQQQQQQYRQQQQNSMLMPFGGLLGGGGGLFGNMMQHMEHDPNAHVYSQSTLITFDGSSQQPRVVHATNSMAKAGPVKEVRRTVRDSGTGEERMQVGKHIGDRGHVVEKKRVRGGDIEQQQQFVNLPADAADEFASEWQRRTGGSSSSSSHRARELTYHPDQQQQPSASAEPTPIVEEPPDEQPAPPASNRRKRRVLPKLPSGPKIFEL